MRTVGTTRMRIGPRDESFARSSLKISIYCPSIFCTRPDTHTDADRRPRTPRRGDRKEVKYMNHASGIAFKVAKREVKNDLKNSLDSPA